MRTRERRVSSPNVSVRRAASDQALGYVSISVIYRDASPFDALDYRVAKAMDEATVRRLPDGTYRATTPAIEFFYDDGPTRKAALEELREDARWLLADPVRVEFVANGRTLIAEVLAERHGGYSATVPELPGCCTCGETMEETRSNLVEAAEGWLDAQNEVSAERVRP